MSPLETWEFALEKLRAGHRVILLIVAQSRPPAPGHAGFKLVLSDDGGIAGTIGGGSVEQEMVELAREKLTRKDPVPLLRNLLHHHAPAPPPRPTSAQPSGMICGGSQTILLLPLHPREIAVVSRIVAGLRGGEPFRVDYTPDGIAHFPGSGHASIEFNAPATDEFLLRENIALPTVTIIGGGHVALALCEVLSRLDFRIVVMDERPDAPTMKKNRFAHRKLTVDYAGIAALIPDGPRSYAVIMTPSHGHDEAVLAQLAGKRFAYLGMMGSPPKVKEIFSRLKAAGVPEDALKKVHAPIGLPIHSHTAAEIAISIAAELISVKNAQQR